MTMFSVLFEQVPDGDEIYLDWILSGVGWTLYLAAAGWCLAFVIGVLVGCGRTSRNRWVAVLARLYVEIFRNIPVIVQMFLWYFVVPELLPRVWGEAMKQMAPPWGNFMPALFGLTLYTAARVAEHIKAGIESVPRGQRMAAASLGMTPFATYRLVILPQALRIVVPTLTSELMGIFKNTSVALTIGVLELTAQARQVSEFTFQTFQAFGIATLLYLILAMLVYAVMRYVERKLTIPGTHPTRPRSRRARARARADRALKGA